MIKAEVNDPHCSCLSLIMDETSDISKTEQVAMCSRYIFEGKTKETFIATIPATSCSAERAFSGLRRLKTYLRNTMGQARLTSLALINIERVFSNRLLEKLDAIVDIFAGRHGRASHFF
ncbi:uncharacterized protein LOC126827953 [Patella vulgata]|uniref:uncharacterized protein LOC126827953 n=1 Tax=Patella vulgata TaxID=6465 RepID=UPI00218060ED|nr:uncharacterized protein LOC126827953 [Patella vulgata]